jgi:hypothetical protein
VATAYLPPSGAGNLLNSRPTSAAYPAFPRLSGFSTTFQQFLYTFRGGDANLELELSITGVNREKSFRKF